MESNYNFIGYSNGVAYNLLLHEGLFGLVQLENWLHPVWCKFDSITTA
jgi:hypothetical protein